MSLNFMLNNIAKTYIEDFNCILEEMIEKMTGACLSDSISHNFIVQMIPHHRAAIDMSENILKYTDNPALIKIAQGIIDEQTKSIANMEQILCCCSQLNNSDRDRCEYQNRMDKIMNVMFSNMSAARATDSLNCDFMWEMIPHHRGAVQMSENTLKYCICQELKPILKAIISSQRRGIAQMQRLLCSLGC